MSRFTSKVVVITGGSSGIGLASAQEFERKGPKVVVTGRNPDHWQLRQRHWARKLSP